LSKESVGEWNKISAAGPLMEGVGCNEDKFVVEFGPTPLKNGKIPSEIGFFD
jgi:hypothetical protein